MTTDSETTAPTRLIPYREAYAVCRPSPAQIAESQGQCVLDVFDDALFGPLGVVASARSLSIPDNLPREQGLALVGGLLTVRDHCPFWLADAIKYAEEHYGIPSSQAIEIGAVSERMLGEALSIGRVAPSIRKAKLSADHHVAVSSAKPANQKAALDQAEASRMSPNATRQLSMIIMDTAAALQPQAPGVPVPIVTLGAREGDDGRMVGGQRIHATRDGAFAFITKYLSREDQAWLAVKLDTHVRGFGAGEVYMDPDVPTSAVYAGMPGFEGEGIGEEPEPEEDLPLAERILAVIARLKGATLAMLYAEMPMLPQKPVRERFYALQAAGEVVKTGYMRQFTAEDGSLDTGVEWAVADGAGEEGAIDAEYRDAAMFAGTGADAADGAAASEGMGA